MRLDRLDFEYEQLVVSLSDEEQEGLRGLV